MSADHFKELVDKDLKGRCTPEEEATLNADLQLWSDELTLIYQDTCGQLSTRKGQVSVGRVPNHEYKAYLTWKGGTTHFIAKLLDKRRDVKAALREENRENNEPREKDSASGHGGIQGKILLELQSIRKLLETRG